MIVDGVYLQFGDVAQLGERVVRNDEVVGSIPIISTNPFDIQMIIRSEDTPDLWLFQNPNGL